MALPEIVLYPDEPLVRVSDPYESVGPQVVKLAARMFQVMDSQEGCGLAGPQIGVARRILVLHDPETDTRLCLLNPEIGEMRGEIVREEGCLSLPGIYAEVARAAQIRVKALDKHGDPLDFEAEGLLARIIQHETDHLDGRIFLDRVDVLTREDKLREWKEAREHLLKGEPASTRRRASVAGTVE